jgi:hypothetical protein
MLTRLSRPLIPLLTVALATVAAAGPVLARPSAPSARTPVAVKILVGQPHAQARFERWATLQKTSYGYYYDAGQQNTHLTITRVSGGVRYAPQAAGPGRARRFLPGVTQRQLAPPHDAAGLHAPRRRLRRRLPPPRRVQDVHAG